MICVVDGSRGRWDDGILWVKMRYIKIIEHQKDMAFRKTPSASAGAIQIEKEIFTYKEIPIRVIETPEIN